MLSTLTYSGHRRTTVAYRKVWHHPTLELILEFVHPGNLGALPPSPDVVAWKGVQIGLLRSSEEAQRTLWFRY